jgi:hypothetical protein
MSTVSSPTPSTPENGLPSPAVANLRTTRKEQAGARQASKGAHPAGTKRVAAKKAPAKAPAPASTVTVTAATRKAPQQSAKPKLKWRGDVAEAEGVEVGRRVQSGDKWDAVIKVEGKDELVATGVSRDRAYAIVVAFYHRGIRPVQKGAVA